MSFGDYLVQKRNFKKSSHRIEYPNLVAKKYNLFAMFHFKGCGEPMEVFANFSAEE